ncbi:replication-relaxation family protein [Alicyclobacillus macrosporangiidus]|uniref:replication-relaxation family protein n=1 Tax=Alicyclobacillus macrosporangiidus TaxID=392015 RepID=UPI000690F05C|nr:replication-relaxation family protein [Alicyclobacillus macrosporangiidus]
MILQWRDSDFVPEQQLLGVVFDAGVILRQDALFVLGWSEAKLERYVTRLKNMWPEPLLRGFWVRRNTYAYLLTEVGVRFVHQMIGLDTKPVTIEAQTNHTLGLNAILMRYLRMHGFEGVRWFSTREAADELWFLRKMTSGELDTDLRSTAIRPDAALRTPDGFWWIEYDNATENSRQIWRKYHMYAVNLEPLDASFQRVVWVTKNEARRRFLETIWKRTETSSVQMEFYVENDEGLFCRKTVG